MEEFEFVRPEPTWSKPCEAGGCSEVVERYRGEGDVQCGNGHWYNAGGQRLRDNWMGNRSNWDDDVSDLDGYEEQMIREDW